MIPGLYQYEKDFLKEALIEAWKNPDNPISSRIIISPHTAFYSKTAWYEMRYKAAKNVARIIQGKNPLNIINS